MPTKKLFKAEDLGKKKIKNKVKSSRIKTKNQRSNPFFHHRFLNLTQSLDKEKTDLDAKLKELQPILEREINRALSEADKIDADWHHNYLEGKEDE
jgi:hypothetical protein